MSRIRVIGIGADGWAALSPALRDEIAAASLLIGGERHLAMVPPVPGQWRETWPSPLREGLDDLLGRAGGDAVALASGDPFVAGIATTLQQVAGEVSVEPAVSSVALARARMGWPAETMVVVRDARTLPRVVAPRRRVLVLSADETTPRFVADRLVDLGYGRSTITALADLGAATESRTTATAEQWRDTPPRLHVLAIACEGPARPTAPGLPDDLFAHDGQLTKRDIRASALARLAPFPGGVLWDVGAGAGSVGIEWMLASGTGTTIAIERDPGRADRIEENARRLGVPGIRVLRRAAGDAVADPDLPRPDAVFLGGGITSEVIGATRTALRPGGVLVGHAVARETVRLLEDAHADLGGELTRLRVEHVDRLGGFTGWKPSRAITQWCVRKDLA